MVMIWFWLVVAVVMLVLLGYSFRHTYIKGGWFYDSRAGIRLPIQIGIVTLAFGFGAVLGQLFRIWF